MKKILLATVALAALAAPAAAADLAARPTYTKAPVLAPVQTWTGFYIGAMGGYANENADFAAMKGGFAGGTVGYNWQQGAVVFGLEADAAWADINATVGALGVTAESKIRDWGTVRGRIGYAFGPTLLYATGGYAWADNRISLTAPGISVSDSKFHSGWTVGAGVEYMFAPHWSLKGEYLYKSFGGESYTFTGLGTLTTGTLNVHSGQVGINYHF
ncbi:putative outer-membrane protein, secreted protein [Bradyrhizobium sp. ORS 375]|uniref:outer membrane protein n=1 Tax=Bradyrhizobium sp. (strain ORS 375) TaxID=566679 RepID=UPI0002405DA0|nr:outer membrane protein [Bradyrhizobium sp. ORS 375]CCD92988.1 putative outer-membrane protein, secreted protein [Bradyrhizobium sp. ORS 375]